MNKSEHNAVALIRLLGKRFLSFCSLQNAVNDNIMLDPFGGGLWMPEDQPYDLVT